MPRLDQDNRTRYWRHRGIAGLSLMQADFTTHEYAPHSHDALVVAITELGGSEFKSGGISQEALPGEVLVFNPQEPHSGHMGRSKRWRYRSFYLTEPALAAIGRLTGSDALPYFRSNRLADPSLVRLMAALHEQMDIGGDAEREEELLVSSFGQLYQAHGEGDRKPDLMFRDEGLLRRAMRIMDERHSDTVRLEHVGDELGLTPFQLIHLFKRGIGLTPHTYLTKIRLHAAIKAMKDGLPIADAATQAGFYDQSALTHHFKRAYGLTPRQYVLASRRILPRRSNFYQ